MHESRNDRTRLENLAQKIEPASTWADTAVPEQQLRVLRELAAYAAHRSQVSEDRRSEIQSLPGRIALFTGANGTGKTMAAEALAGDLHLELYRIDLTRVVSKYIGETEKNLSRIFTEAAASGAILFFDEADALFGKRSEVKDSHDRYANIEVSYLLQRMEEYRGLAVLTTNLKSSLDSAFLRRLRFVVQFPFPDAAHRAAIWRAVFPPGVPTQGLDWGRLASLRVAGGNIRSIALNAAFLAADAGESVGMAHVLAATRSEYAKLERPLTPTEVAGWG